MAKLVFSGVIQLASSVPASASCDVALRVLFAVTGVPSSPRTTSFSSVTGSVFELVSNVDSLHSASSIR